jgi:hypothetical protein
MKRLLKKYEKYLSIHYYVIALRRQPSHMQHVYAAVFAGFITVLLGVMILYFDYGFWHERYSREETLEEVQVPSVAPVEVRSPGDMLGGFFKEARSRLDTIKTSSSSLLEGKETYNRSSDEGAEDATDTP